MRERESKSVKKCSSLLIRMFRKEVVLEKCRMYVRGKEGCESESLCPYLDLMLLNETLMLSRPHLLLVHSLVTQPDKWRDSFSFTCPFSIGSIGF